MTSKKLMLLLMNKNCLMKVKLKKFCCHFCKYSSTICALWLLVPIL